MPQPKLSLIISFYNKIDALKLVLAGLDVQTFKDFEIIIADDGSRPEVVNEIKAISRQSIYPVRHIWHEDKGWRKNIILNKAVQASSTDYLIFIDGDCIPHPKFTEEHYNNREQGTILVGRRQHLSAYISKKLTPRKIKKGYLGKHYYLIGLLLRMFNQGNHTEKGMYFKSPNLRQRVNKKTKGIVGSNFSIHKADLLSLNGFDERFVYPGAGEDSDIRNRWRNKNGKLKTLNNIAVQYHLYHKMLDRDKRNLVFLDENIEKKVVFTPYGINKA